MYSIKIANRRIMMKTDSQIQTEVMQELKWDPSVTHEHIGVSVSDGIVTLSGSVPSYVEKFAAEKATQRLSGVKAIVEKIDVKIPALYKRDDQDIAKAILNQFRWNVKVPDELIRVSVENGWVKLVGEVEWDYQRTAAEKCARELSGVRGVSNNVTLKITKVQPELIKQKIEEALKREAVHEAKRIAVAVNGSTVTLSGEVHSFAEMNDAKWAAWSAPGVTRIENNLRIAS
jgi:osmotically-inducible protein OsmY